jgi:pseudouridine kinase
MKHIVCIGGSNVDMFLKPIKTLILEDSNPGDMHISYGGVGRNVAENLARLSIKPYFITILGQDEHGSNIYEFCRNIGIQIDPIYVAKTPVYVAVLNHNHDMHVSISVMKDFDKLDQIEIEKRRSIIEMSNYLFIDTNMSEQTMKFIFNNFEKPIFVDAISTSKARRLVPYLAKVFALKVNLKEALALTGLNEKETDEIKIAQTILSLGVQHVFITLGASGAIYLTQDDMKRSYFKPTQMVNASGAGDAFMAGVIYAFMNEKEPLQYGVAAALITVKAEEAVSPSMSKEYLEKTVEELI